MLKSLVNLPFRVLGHAARAVQRHQDGVIRANHGVGKSDDPPRSVPDFDTPKDYDPPELALTLDDYLDGRRKGVEYTLVDTGDSEAAASGAEIQAIPLGELNMRLAELPPEPSLLLFVDESEDRARTAARFVRFRGHEGAHWLIGGRAALRRGGQR